MESVEARFKRRLEAACSRHVQRSTIDPLSIRVHFIRANIVPRLRNTVSISSVSLDRSPAFFSRSLFLSLSLPLCRLQFRRAPFPHSLSPRPVSLDTHVRTGMTNIDDILFSFFSLQNMRSSDVSPTFSVFLSCCTQPSAGEPHPFRRRTKNVAISPPS